MEAWSNSPKDTEKIAKELAKSLRGGEVIALFGDLGAGKTVFVRGLAKGLGIKKKITSPTFVYMKSYTLKISQKPLTFYHLDLYRAASGIETQNLGIDELFSPDSIVVLEWAEKIKDSLPKKRIDVAIKAENEKERRIKIDRRV